MKRSFAVASAGIASALLMGAAQAAEITIFTQPTFTGRSITIDGQARHLGSFAGLASSIVVSSGRWEACTLPDFRGDCTIIEQGQYSRLEPRYINRIASLRPIDPLASLPRERIYAYERVYPVETVRVERVETAPVETVVIDRVPAADPYPRLADLGSYGALEVYSERGFRGMTMKFDREGKSLDSPANLDRGVSSLVIREGTWEICTGRHGDGACRVYEPGSYARLGRFEGAPIGSLRRIG
jgi:hypothetical protein